MLINYPFDEQITLFSKFYEYFPTLIRIFHPSHQTTIYKSIDPLRDGRFRNHSKVRESLMGEPNPGPLAAESC